jgi:hypothetical protein
MLVARVCHVLISLLLVLVDLISYLKNSVKQKVAEFGPSLSLGLLVVNSHVRVSLL